jgi:predicted ester cyclase
MKKTIYFTITSALLRLCALGAEDQLPEPKQIVWGKNEAAENKAAEILAARCYAAFWDTGDEKFVALALDSNFIDRTLPKDRKQGIEGPLEASMAFRGAVPDLKAMIEKMIVADDHVVVHLIFEGHFTGIFNGIQGKGEPIRFIATDIYKIVEGKIIENWHIEDNLTLLQQMGMLS